MIWYTAMWFGAGFGLVLLIALAWDLHDYRQVKRRWKLRTDWARVFEQEKKKDAAKE